MFAQDDMGGTVRPVSRLRGRAGVGALSAMGFAERAPTRLALLGTLPRKREREGHPPSNAASRSASAMSCTVLALKNGSSGVVGHVTVAKL